MLVDPRVKVLLGIVTRQHLQDLVAGVCVASVHQRLQHTTVSTGRHIGHHMEATFGYGKDGNLTLIYSLHLQRE